MRTFQLTNKSEDWKHYLSKCICYKILRDMGRKVTMEHQTACGDYIDVFDHDNRMGYEFQSINLQDTITKKTIQYTRDAQVLDIMFFDLRHIPLDLEKMREIIRRRIA